MPDPDLVFLPVLDLGSRDQKGTGSLIRIRNTGLLDLDRERPNCSPRKEV
jgi:hypothetical protein